LKRLIDSTESYINAGGLASLRVWNLAVMEWKGEGASRFAPGFSSETDGCEGSIEKRA
jgi:hypothetical protein